MFEDQNQLISKVVYNNKNLYPQKKSYPPKKYF